MRAKTIRLLFTRHQGEPEVQKYRGVFMAYHVYILQSLSDGTFYTGFTNDLQRRLKEHNSGHTLTTAKHKPWKIVYTEEAASLAEARRRELYLKSAAGRRYREKILIRKQLSGYLPD